MNKTIIIGIVLLVGLIISNIIWFQRVTAFKVEAQDQDDSIKFWRTTYEQLLTEHNRIKNILSIYRIDPDKKVMSKIVDVSIYTSRRQETDSTPYITANNDNVRPGGVAVSDDLFVLLGGFGKEIMLQGYGRFVINDKMNKRFRNTVDIWDGDLKAAKLHGRQKTLMVWQ